MAASDHIVTFRLNPWLCALPLGSVERVVPAVAIDPLPHAPAAVLGVINAAGRIVPVFSVRRRLRQEEREVELSDQLILARTSRRAVALLVDGVDGVLECAAAERVPAGAVIPGLEGVAGIARRPDGLILIYDLDGFLSLEEEEALGRALAP